jgi:hypothetical protein
MLRHALAALVTLLLLVGGALAADKEIKGKLVKVDSKNKVIAVMTDEGMKRYDVNDDTKFIGPKGGASELGIKDDRLVKGAEVTLVVAGNNRTIREVRLPERKGKIK